MIPCTLCLQAREEGYGACEECHERALRERDEARATLDEANAEVLTLRQINTLRNEERDDAREEARLEARDRDKAVKLLRAVWHGEGPDKWPDPVEFRRRVEALVGPPPPGEYTNAPTKES